MESTYKGSAGAQAGSQYATAKKNLEREIQKLEEVESKVIRLAKEKHAFKLVVDVYRRKRIAQQEREEEMLQLQQMEIFIRDRKKELRYVLLLFYFVVGN